MSFTQDMDSDNYTTNGEEWRRIKQFIPRTKKIWSPFYCDGKQKQHFNEMGIDIIHEDEDFFQHNKGEIVVDNPPFSKRREILERLHNLDKPFILILPSMMLGYKYFQILFKQDLQIIVPCTRIKFKHLNSSNKNYTPPYACFYFCWKMKLPKDLIFI